MSLGGQAFIRGSQSLKLSTKTAVLKRVDWLIGGQACQLGGPPLGAGLAVGYSGGGQPVNRVPIWHLHDVFGQQHF